MTTESAPDDSVGGVTTNIVLDSTTERTAYVASLVHRTASSPDWPLMDSLERVVQKRRPNGRWWLHLRGLRFSTAVSINLHNSGGSSRSLKAPASSVRDAENSRSSSVIRKSRELLVRVNTSEIRVSADEGEREDAIGHIVTPRGM